MAVLNKSPQFEPEEKSADATKQEVLDQDLLDLMSHYSPEEQVAYWESGDPSGAQKRQFDAIIAKRNVSRPPSRSHRRGVHLVIPSFPHTQASERAGSPELDPPEPPEVSKNMLSAGWVARYSTRKNKW